MESVIIQTISLSAVLGIGALLLARRLRVPPLMFYMALGILFGPSFFGLIQPTALSSVLMPFIEVSVAIIIFEAGLALPISGWKDAPEAIRRILMQALPITAVLTTLAVHYVGGLPWSTAALFGSIMIVTGPTVIGPLLRSVALKRRVDNLLSWESTWSDCIGVLVSGVVLEGLISPIGQEIWLPGIFVFRLATGLAVGILAGYALGRWVIPWTARLGDPGLPGSVTLASAIGVFYLSSTIAGHSGVVASAVAGMMLARHSYPELEHIRHFKDQITNLIVAFLFVFLSAQLNIFTLEVNWLALFAVAAIMIVVIRPIAVLIALRSSALPLKERFFIGAIGPRGIIAAAVSSYYVSILSAEHYQATQMLALTFIVIFASGGVTSLFGSKLADVLDASISEEHTGIMLIGYGSFSRKIAEWLKGKVDTIIIDSDPTKCRSAQASSLNSTCRSGLSDEPYEDLLELGFRRVIAMTPNTALNSLISDKAENHVGPNRVFLTTAKNDSEQCQSIREMAGKKLAFSTEGLDIVHTNEQLDVGTAQMKVLLPEEIKENPAAVPLIMMTPENGVRIVRAGEKVKGETLCLVHESLR